MEAVLVKLLNMSIQASLLITVVAVLRLTLKKSPKWLHCLLWVMVAVRLICPFSIESNVSLAPADEIVKIDNFIVEPNIVTGENVNAVTRNEAALMKDVISRNPAGNDLTGMISLIWILGIILMLSYALISSMRVYNRIRPSIKIRDNIYMCDNINSPFIFGIIRPRIYIPSIISGEQMDSVIGHEEAHIKRYDHMWKPLGYVLLAVYWFNPFCWLAYILLCRDIELACDEKVIKNMDIEQKKVYSRVLLSFSERGKYISVCPLAFGEIGVNERIKSVLNYKKPAFWVIVASVIAIIATSVLFLTSPKKESGENNNQPLQTGREETVDVSDEQKKAEEAEKELHQLQEQEEKRSKEINVNVPDIDLSANTGADGSTIYYADKDKFIFGGSYGLFVYDMNKKHIMRSVDLKPIGCNYTQGDSYCEINVTKDGSKVLLHPYDRKDEMYVYNVTDNTMILTEYNIDGYDLYEKEKSENDEWDMHSASYEDGGETKIINLINDTTLGQLGYSDNPAMSYYQPIFFYEVEENMGVEYEEKDGKYIVEGDMVFEYKKVLTGRSPNAECDTKFLVLTNNKDISFEDLNKSILSNNSDDWLDDTVIIGMGVVE